MKILYLVNARIPTPRAYGLQIMKTCEAFVNAGVAVELVTPTRAHRESADPFTYYRITQHFKLTTLSVPDFLKYGSVGFLLSTIWFSEKAHFSRSFWDADIVYSRDPLVLFQYLLLGRRFVFEAHSRPSLVARVVARHAYRLVVISKGLQEEYLRVGVPQHKIVLAPDAVDEHLFDHIPDKSAAAREVGLSQNRKIVLYAGHLYARKGAETLAEAATGVPEARFVFVGGSYEEVAAFRKKWGHIPNIEIVGHMPHEKIPWYLRAADVLVLPNSGKDPDSARLTSPMKLFEYMASGTPMVVSDVPAIREILDESHAVFVSADDSRALARGIEDTLAHPEEALLRACHTRTKVTHYTWKKRAETILASVS